MAAAAVRRASVDYRYAVLGTEVGRVRFAFVTGTLKGNKRTPECRNDGGQDYVKLEPSKGRATGCLNMCKASLRYQAAS